MGGSKITHNAGMSKGQSLVEFAITLPILVFLLIGVFEVGWALHGYLVLANANREAARFAVRQDYLNFSSNNIGYEKVWTHTLESISNQIDYNEQTGDMIISYITVEANCTGTITATTPLQVPTYTWKYPYTSSQTTLLDYNKIVNELGQRQVQYMCNVPDRIHLSNEVIYVEMWYRQAQLMGFPLISNPFTNPVPMYAHSSFRKIPESRDDHKN